MGTYEVSIFHMNEAVEDAQQAAKAIQSLLDQLEAECSASLSTWTGDAQAQYHTAREKWHAAAENMPTAIQAGAQTLSNIAEGYVRAEQAGTNAFAG